MRTFTLATAALLAASLSAQDQASTSRYSTWIAQNFASLSGVTAIQVIDQAKAAGVATTWAELAELKAAFRAAQPAKDRAGSRTLYDTSSQPPFRRRSSTPEVESNDCLDRAQEVGNSSNVCVTGDNSLADDVDFYKFSPTTNDQYVFSIIAPVTGSVIADSYLEIYNQFGELIAENDDANGGLLSEIAMFLPAGNTYYVSADKFDETTGGAYELVINRTPAVEVACSATGTTGSTGTSFHALRRTTSSFANLRVLATSPTADLALLVTTASGRVYSLNDDDERGSSSNPNDPGLDIDLSPHDYYVTVINTSGSAPEPYSLLCSTGGLGLLNVCSIAGGSFSVNASGSTLLATLDVNPGGELVTITTSATATNPIVDTTIAIYDRNMTEILTVDDYQTADRYSRVQLDLPPQFYYVAFRGFGSAVGGIQLNATCAPGGSPTQLFGYGDNTTTVPGGGTVDAGALEPCDGTQCIGFDWDTGNFAAVNALGESLGARGGRHSQAIVQPFLTYLYSYSETSSSSFPQTLTLTGQLRCDATSGNLTAIGQAGQVTALLASIGRGFGQTHPVIDGLICINTPAITIGIGVYDAQGRVTLLTPCPSFGGAIAFQGFDLFVPALPSGTVARVTNLLEL